jgi:hypothetical protein
MDMDFLLTPAGFHSVGTLHLTTLDPLRPPPDPLIVASFETP